MANTPRPRSTWSTKTGTNAFHGDVFEFLRNGVLNSAISFARRARQPEAQSVRRHCRRTDSQGSLVLLPGLSGNICKVRSAEHYCEHSHAGHVERGFHRLRVGRLPGEQQDARRAAPFVNNQISPTLFSTPALNFIKHLPGSRQRQISAAWCSTASCVSDNTEHQVRPRGLPTQHEALVVRPLLLRQLSEPAGRTTRTTSSRPTRPVSMISRNPSCWAITTRSPPASSPLSTRR